MTIIFKKPEGQKPMPALFRISTAIDVRKQKLVEVFLPNSNRKLGVLDIKYSPVFQPYELPISVDAVEEVLMKALL